MKQNLMLLMPEMEPYEQGYLISVLRLYFRHKEITDRELPLVPRDDAVAALKRHAETLRLDDLHRHERFVPTIVKLRKLLGYCP